jgi:hypothetical protein
MMNIMSYRENMFYKITDFIILEIARETKKAKMSE